MIIVAKRINDEIIKNAIMVKNDLDNDLSKKEVQQAKSLLNEKVTLEEVFDTIDVVMKPTIIKVYSQERNWLLIQYVLDEIGATKEQWDKAKKSLKEAQAHALKGEQEEKKVGESKKDEA